MTAISRMMATRSDHAGLEESLDALLTATSADVVFVDRNVVNQAGELCSTLVTEVTSEGVSPSPRGTWEMVPWTETPLSIEGLSQGRTVSFLVSELPAIEAERYANSQVASELNIPIMIRGEWVGMIGFSDLLMERTWDDHEIALLSTAAEMIGTFWERSDANERLEEVVTRLNHRHQLEEGIVRTSAALLRTGVGALDEVMAALQEATGVDLVFADENFLDPERGLTARVVSYVDSGIDRPNPEAEWWEGPLSDLPTTFAALSRGEAVIINPRDLEEPERSIYLREGLKTELNVPILVRGEWRGSMGLSDYRDERIWDPLDVELIVTVTEMIGAHWERIEADKSMNVRLSYEKALARVSAELLSARENALETAFGYLVAATDTDCMWMERNYMDPEKGLSTRFVLEILSPRLDYTDEGSGEGWVGGPFTEAPTAYSYLSRGEPSIIQTLDLSGEERQMYDDDGQKSELVIPIFVFGEWIGSVGFAHYLHAREWADEDISILRTASELVGLYLERQQTSERLRELVESKDKFIASISHEIRTPLTSVLGFTSVLSDGYDEMPETERRDLLGLIGVEAQEVAWIVEDLLVFARSDIGTLAATSDILDLEEQVAAVVAGQIGEAASRIGFEGSGDRAVGDPGRVRQIIRNLLTNAMKYGGPEIRIITTSTDRNATVHVVDDGSGIDDEQTEMVFDAYYRAHDQAGQPGSMGLGLHVSKQLAQLMGGDLTYSRVDDETYFTLSLPIAGRDTYTAA